MEFIDREGELALIRERMTGDGAEFWVVYGRRRVGKTAIMMQAVAEHGGVILMAREESRKLQLARFAHQVGLHFGEEYLLRNGFADWDAFFEFLASRAGSERTLVVLDEFPYLVKEDPSLPSVLQAQWDTRLKDTRLFLVVMGSSISMMEGLLGHRSPLYGRRTGQLRVRPLRFANVAPLVGDARRAVELFSVFGGTPAHIAGLDLSRPVAESIAEHFLRPGSPVGQDVQFLLREELDEPRYYFSIMEAIALGSTTVGAIMNHTGLERGLVGKYLNVLRELDLVRREVPVTASSRSKQGLYSLGDNIFTFWFRFIFPNDDAIELGHGLDVLPLIERDLNAHVGAAFEDICREAFWGLGGGRYARVGRWWDRGEEIDVVALGADSRELVAMECKWVDLGAGEAARLLHELEKKVDRVDWRNRTRTVRTGLFARAIEGKEDLRRAGHLAFDLADVAGAGRGARARPTEADIESMRQEHAAWEAASLRDLGRDL